MSINVYPEPINNGDPDIWGPKELNQNRLSLGLNTCRLNDDAGILKLSIGEFGLVTPSRYQKIQIDAAVSISLSGLTASRWAKIECSVSALVASISITSISAGTSASTIPSEFSGAYSALKGGFYIDSSKRCLGLVWIDSGGLLDGVVNQLQAKDGYAGYSNSSANNFLVIDGLDMIGTYAYRNLGGAIGYDPTNSQFTVSHKTKVSRPVLHVQDQKSSGTDGGTSSAGGWNDRTLNTIVMNTIVGASLASDEITLPAGTYYIDALSPFFRCDKAQIKLRNTGAAADVVGLWSPGIWNYGTTASALSSGRIRGIFTLASPTTLKIQYQVQSGYATTGLGIKGGYGLGYEIYTDVWIEQIA